VVKFAERLGILLGQTLVDTLGSALRGPRFGHEGAG
jgi:hypothetical protein